MFKIGDLVDWDGRGIINGTRHEPKRRGQITRLDTDWVFVKWPGERIDMCHLKTGSARNFTLSVQDNFETTGVE